MLNALKQFTLVVGIFVLSWVIAVPGLLIYVSLHLASWVLSSMECGLGLFEKKKKTS